MGANFCRVKFFVNFKFLWISWVLLSTKNADFIYIVFGYSIKSEWNSQRISVTRLTFLHDNSIIIWMKVFKDKIFQ